MEIKTEVRFGNEHLKKAYNELNNRTFQEALLKKWLDRAIGDLEINAFCGTQIPKKLIPKEYEIKFGTIHNLWKYDLPNGWRMIYTIKKDKVVVLSIILEWLNHKDYEKRFKY